MSMYVMKRSGKRESVHFDKITSRVSKLCYGLDAKVRGFPQIPLSHSPYFKHDEYGKINFTPVSLCSIKHVDPVVITQKVIQGVYPGVTTSELDE